MPVAPVPFPFSLATVAPQTIATRAQMIKAPADRWQNDARWSLVIEQGGVSSWFQDAGAFDPTDGAPPLANIDSFVFGSHTPVNQHIQLPMVPADYPALAPGKLVRVNGVIDWYRYTYAVAPVARVFVKVNGIGLTNIPGTLLFSGSGPTAFNLTAVADGSGQVLVEFGIYLDDGVGSASIGASLLYLDVTNVDEDPWDIIYDSAVLYYDGTKPISISREGARFEERATIEEYEYEGKVAPTYLGDEITSVAPVLIVKFMNVGEKRVAQYQPGGAWQGSSFDRTFTPSALRTALAAGFYLSDVRCIWKRWSGGYLQVRFPKALASGGLAIGSTDKNEGEIPVVIAARQDLSAGVVPKTTPVYYVDRLPSTWTI